MADTFDPYREWLGIGGGRAAADHYRVFGLPRFAGNPQVIAVAAELTIARIAKLGGEEHAAARDQMLADLALARACLLDPAARARYDAALRGEAAPVAAEAPMLTATAATAAAAVESDPWQEFAGDDRPLPPRNVPIKRRHDTAPLVAGVITIVLLLAAAGGAGYVLWAEREPEPRVVQAPSEPVESIVLEEAPVEKPAAPADRIRPEPKAVDVPVPRPAKADDTVQAKTTREDSRREAPQKDGKASLKAEVERALTRARLALAARNPEAAQREIAAAARIAGDDSLGEQVEDFRAVADAWRDFWKSVQTGMRQYQPTDEVTIGDLVAAIVEVDEDRVTLFIEGKRRSFTPANMPLDMALFFARSGSDEHATATRLRRGVFESLDPLGDRQEARRLLQSAAAEDEVAAAIAKAVLSLPLRAAVPDLATLAVASSNPRLAKWKKSATTTARRVEAARELLKLAEATDAIEDRYAALVEARRLAEAAGDIDAALAVVEQLDKWFEVDGQSLEAETLIALAGRNLTPQAAQKVTNRLLDQLDAAQKNKQPDRAEDLAEAALKAARKTRDGELVKQVTRRRAELDGKSR